MTVYAKAIGVVLIQIIGQAITLGLLNDQQTKYAELVIGAITAIGVYLIQNKPPASPVNPELS